MKDGREEERISELSKKGRRMIKRMRGEDKGREERWIEEIEERMKNWKTRGREMRGEKGRNNLSPFLLHTLLSTSDILILFTITITIIIIKLK